MSIAVIAGIFAGAIFGALAFAVLDDFEGVAAPLWGALVGALVAATGIFVAVETSAGLARRDRLMAQCLADGKKEYECAGLLSEPHSSIVPIIIPVH